LSKIQSRTSTTTGSPEIKLLLCCAQARKNVEGDTRIRALLQQEIDWAWLLGMAREHGMVPLLYWHLYDTYSEAIPKAALEELRNFHYGNISNNLFLTGELLKLLNLFEAHAIPAVPFKGPALTAFVYGNLALREFVDLDILVHERDVSRARELLISVGYRPEYQLTAAQEAAFEAAFLPYGYSREFTHRDGKSQVDLHWRITERRFSTPLDPENLWGRLERVHLRGKSILTLSPEDLLLILCVHGSKHLWRRLSLLCDVAELIHAHKKMNWGQVMEWAATLGSERMLFLGLYLANDLLGAALPEGVLHKVRADPTLKVLAGQVYERLFQEASDPSEASRFQLFHIRMRERLGDKVRFCVGTAATITRITVADWEVLPLPRYLYPLYYVVRLVRLSNKYTRRLLRRLPFYN